jgi:hypothetical protein
MEARFHGLIGFDPVGFDMGWLHGDFGAVTVFLLRLRRFLERAVKTRSDEFWFHSCRGD